MKKFQWSKRSLIALSIVALCNESLGNDARGEIEARIQCSRLEIAQRAKDGASASDVAALQSACDALSEELATPPSRDTRLAASIPQGMPPANVFGTPPPGTTVSTTEFAHAGFPIPDSTISSSVINVSGLDPYLWDVDLRTWIQHTANGDLNIRLISPKGTTVTISTRNGQFDDGVFAMTWWDDDASELVTDRMYSNNTNSPLLVPEGALSAFVGENPNGAWNLTIHDANVGNTGALLSWGLRFTTLSPSPMNTPALVFSNPNALAIPDAGPAVVSTIAVSMPGTCICDLDLNTFIVHARPADLVFSLRSPLGTEVLVSSHNGSNFLYAFDGTRWDDDALTPVTDAMYQPDVFATPLTPEGAFGAFHGENPNGIWTFKIQDPLTGDVGGLYEWSLEITTCSAPLPEPFCFGDGSGMECPCHNNNPLGSQRGCLNGLGRGAKLTGIGGQSVSADSVQLTTEDTPFLSYVLYWQSRYTPNAGLGSVFDDGLLCSSTPVMFLGSKFTDSSLKTQFPGSGTPLHTLGAVPPSGGTRFIQAWYRDAGNVCGTHNNLTNGLKVNWVP